MTYNKFELIAGFGQCPVVILGNLRSSDFELVDLSEPPMSEDVERDLSRRGMCFVGVIGIVEGAAKVALAEPLDAITVTALSGAFVQRVEDAINAKLRQKNDGLVWLESLYQMPDTRTDS
jgi:hypothetical protein